MHGPYPKQTQLLCVVWRYRLWAACPCLSWSADTFIRSIVVESDSEGYIVSFSLNIRAYIARVQIWNVHVRSYPFVQFKFSLYGHTYRTYTCVLQCSHASVGLAQAHPNFITQTFNSLHIQTQHTTCNTWYTDSCVISCMVNRKIISTCYYRRIYIYPLFNFRVSAVQLSSMGLAQPRHVIDRA